MNYETQKKVACIGIAGAGVHYVAKFFADLGIEVYGYDVKKTANTEELEKLGVRIYYENPQGKIEPDTSLFVYAPGLPDNLLAEIEKNNAEIEHVDVGYFTDELAQKYEKNELSTKELAAFISSDIAPLYTLNTSKMTFIGITGTDGKTTTSTMIYHLLQELGYKPGLISTVSAKIGDKSIDTGFHTTTPAPQELHKFLKMMESEDCTHAIIETTSHALAMGRIAGIKFDAIAYTNITSEHLDYHKTWENYFLAKSRLLSELLKDSGFAVANADETVSFPRLLNIARDTHKSIISYGESEIADRRITQIIESDDLQFTFSGEKVTLPTIGRFNVLNASAAITLVQELTKRPLSEVTQKIKNFETITGRMQFEQLIPFKVIVDFAHTANALNVALQAVREQKENKKNKVIVVFGCAGKRDPKKRFPMGEAAGKYADITILTAEDPRTESLSNINDEIEKGWKSTANKDKHLIRFDDESLLVEVRKQAIEAALKLANAGDVVIICGKAHEESLCFGLVEYPWSDITETRKLLKTEK